MDPYLEDPNHWPNVHYGLIAEIQAQLNSKLRPRYVATIEIRAYVEPVDDPASELYRIPDCPVESLPRSPQPEWTDEPVELPTMDLSDEIEEALIIIVEPRSREVATVIEVLSPSNKVPGAQGRRSYTKKRDDVMHSPAHWVEIDLLRSGRPTFPRGRLRPEYAVHVSRAERRPKGLVWPVRLRAPLPIVSIPLRGGDPDVPLDLQAVLSAVYDRGAFDLLIDYREPPTPPLAPDADAWADALLRQRGLRPGPRPA
jgi:hypothetical protein